MSRETAFRAQFAVPFMGGIFEVTLSLAIFHLFVKLITCVFINSINYPVHSMASSCEYIQTFSLNLTYHPIHI